VDGHLVTCPSDDAAKAMASHYLAGYAAVEVWIERRRIARLASAPPNATPPQEAVPS
jgi:hypothetical protein